MTSGRDDIQLHRVWQRQLILEFDEICSIYAVELSHPVFEISDAEKELGAWYPTTRCLRLSRNLIVNYSWSVTVQVLKHEMAHQLCSERYGSSDTAHGRTFQRACETLGVSPEYRQSKALIDELAENATDGSEKSQRGRKCLAKVEKLLALARSANEHEASLALKKANELIEKYHLQGLSDGVEYQYGFSIIDRKRKRFEGYQRHICSILQDFFFVKIVLSSLYDPKRNDTYKTIELLGTKDNVAVAEYCYHFLENQLALLWSRNRHKFRGAVRTEKNSYYLGLLRGFYQKLQQQGLSQKELHRKPGMKELVVAEERRQGEFVAIRFPRLRKVRARRNNVYSSTYEEGVATGKKINFTHGISKKEDGGCALLT